MYLLRAIIFTSDFIANVERCILCIRTQTRKLNYAKDESIQQAQSAIFKLFHGGFL